MAVCARKLPQFSLRTLMWIVAACGVLSAVAAGLLALPTVRQQLAGIDGVAALVLVALSLGLSLLGLPAQPQHRWPFARAFAALGLLVVCHEVCALVSWHTLGEVRSCGYWLLAPATFVPTALCATRAYRLSLAASIVIAGLLLPIAWAPQAVLWHRLVQVVAEAERIGAHAQRVKEKTGAYPDDLSDYHSNRPHLAQYIHYLSPASMGSDKHRGNYIVVCDLFEGDYTNREYSPKGWYYYPD